MRVALIADIHGNHIALETVLADVARRSVERVICLGDVAALGPEPATVVRTLRWTGCATVLGNTDAWLLGPDAAEQCRPDPGTEAELTAWTVDRLDPADLDWLRRLPRWLDVDLGDGVFLRCSHGSPRSHSDVVMSTTPDDELAAMLGEPTPAMVAGGHTHVAMLRRWRATTLLNPGSVGLAGIGPTCPGLPRNHDVRWAEYAIVSAVGGAMSAEIHRLPLDVDRMIATAFHSGMPHSEWWIGRWRT